MGASLRLSVLGNAGSWYCEDLRRAAESRGHSLTRFDFSHLTSIVKTSQEAWDCQGKSLGDLDALLVRTMPPGSLEQVVFRMDLLAQLERQGVTVLNSPKAIECAVDKYLTTARLAAVDLPVPATAICEHTEAAMESFTRLGGDVVVKPLFGAEGRGILRVSDPDLAFRTFRTLERLQSVIYQQQFIAHPGFDLRVLLLDGRVLGAIRRYSPEDFRTNVSRQGKAVAWTPTDEEVHFARQAATATAATFAGVDLLEDEQGKRYVIEVNAVPGWRAFQRATGVDVATTVLQFLEL